MKTIFDRVLNGQGIIDNEQHAKGRLAVLDIGKHTVDLVLTDALQFVDNKSISFHDIGIFDAYRDLSLRLKEHGYDIPADSLEPYIRNGKNLKGLHELKELIFANQAEKILSRVYNTLPDLWNIDLIYITGGEALVLGNYLIRNLKTDKAVIFKDAAFTNCRGFFKFAKKMW